MAEPVSLVASVIAVATLAETVVTKGYQYLKAVKDCPQDVRSLMAEVNVLCGVLDRLGKLFQVTENDTLTAPEDDGEDANLVSSSVSEDSASPAADTLGTPSFIYECQNTLGQIQDTLHKFGDSSDTVSQSDYKKSRFSVDRLRSLKAKDLKWPLAKSKTLELIGRLERHKATCTIALASTGIAGVHSVLRETGLSNKYLAEIRAKQETMLKLQLSQEQEKALSWLSPVNPALKHRAFARERQDGTGIWLFDLPEMTYWLESPNAALWIYGIPGAGKTTLSTLVVDEVLNRKRSNSIGTAYFYVRHDDKDSHKPSNVLGSLIRQLACQNSDALAEFMELHAQHQAWGSSVPPPPDDELLGKLRDLSRHFSETFIMIDGIDECGPAFNPDRTILIDAVAKLNDIKERSIRTLIFSRDEYDIRKTFTSMQFHTISVAATSADLRLFVNAWLGKIDIGSERLKTEIVDTLVDEANGMFMWVRAQVDYLQRLPNDAEIRQALGKLPPDLPQTYVRILETIDSNYRGQTPKYIQRLLKWILFSARGKIGDFQRVVSDQQGLSIEALCEAICIEDEYVWPTEEVLPKKDQILRWLGCLVRVNHDTNELRFAHFSVEEFLRMDAGALSNSVARNYLVHPEDKIYLINTCLTYVMHSHFNNISCTSWEDVNALFLEHPFYAYIASRLTDHIMDSETAERDCGSSIRKFLATPPCCGFKLWATCQTSLIHHHRHLPHPRILNLPSPLHFASATGLISQAARLLEEGASPDATELSKGQSVTPLHLAISGGYKNSYIDEKAIVVYDNVVSDSECSLALAEMLVGYGADVNRQTTMIEFTTIGESAVLPPLNLALYWANWRVANFLLHAGAEWDARAQIDLQADQIDLCSFKRYMEFCPAKEDKIEHFIELSDHRGLREALEEWRYQRHRPLEEWTYQRHRRDNDSQRMSKLEESAKAVQDLFIDAFTNGRWEEARDLVTQHESLDLNRLNKEGMGAVHYASIQKGDTLSMLLGLRADPNLVTKEGKTALGLASSKGCIENIRLLLEKGSNLESRDRQGRTPLLIAVNYNQPEAVQVLLDAGADPNLATDRGNTALNFASREGFVEIITLLLENGSKLESRNHQGWTPLLSAVNANQQEALQVFLDARADVNAKLNDGSGALQISLRRKYTNMVTALLNRGIDCFTPDNFGTTPLHVACYLGLEEQVEQMLALSQNIIQDIDADSLFRGTCLYTASRQGFTSIIKTLLRHGATVNKVGPGNLLGPALMVACAGGHTKAVEIFLANGAALEVEGSRFNSASGTARAFRQDKVLRLLEDLGAITSGMT
ncbi:MAG: hypothetical protein Q9199_003807 [Rusavskia elegans]